MPIKQPQVYVASGAAGRAARPQKPIAGRDRRLDRWREQHGHVRGLARVPCLNEFYRILDDLRPKRAARSRFPLRCSAAPILHFALVESHGGGSWLIAVSVVPWLSSDLTEALGLGNIPHWYLRDRAEAYRAIVDQDLEGVDFSLLYVEGVRLANAERAAVSETELPPLPQPIREAIDTLLQVHGSFILATAEGVEAVAAEVQPCPNGASTWLTIL